MGLPLAVERIWTAIVLVLELEAGSRWLTGWATSGSPWHALSVIVLGGVPLVLTGYLHRYVDQVDWKTVVVWSAGGALGGAALGLWIGGDGALSAVAVARPAIGGAVGGGIAGTKISQTRQALETAERERHRWKSLFAEAPTAVADLSICESEITVVTVNEAFRNTFPTEAGYEGQPFSAVVTPHAVDAEFHSAVETGTAITREFVVSVADDTRYFRLRLIPYQYDSTQRAFAIITDGTSLKQTERELQAAISELSEKNKRLEEFASVVSHDLRNPVNVAAGHLELVEAPGDGQHLEKASAALDRIEALVSDLLTLAREGKAVGDLDPVALDAAVNHAWDTVDEADMDLRVDAETTVLADETRLQQLFENLFRNAREHAGSDVTVTVDTLDREPGFFVADDGPGIPADEREGIFEPGSTSKSTGTGLGLDIVRAIARGHDWNVDVTESAEGGARFEFRGVDRL